MHSKIAGINRCDAELLCKNTYESAETQFAHLNEGFSFSSQNADIENFFEACANEPRNCNNRKRESHLRVLPPDTTLLAVITFLQRTHFP